MLSLQDQETPLHVAVDFGYTKIVSMLIQAGGNPKSFAQVICI